jgi:GNAT superfamily N-acetyltransferase
LNILIDDVIFRPNLVSKLERTEARATVDFVESRAKLFPESCAGWIDVAGTYAMFDGAESPCTQTFGLGVFGEITHAELDTLEAFFQDRGAPVFHEVSPLADPALVTLLNERGYQPIELTSVMYRPLEGETTENRPANADIVTRIINAGEEDLWARTSAKGWSTEMPGLADFMYEFGRIGARSAGARPFVAELDGKPISTGALFIYDDAALLAGASTIPEGRNRGAQNALLDARLRYAAAQGCAIAIMGARPGSQSQRNAEKNGFRIAYTRTKWQLKV